MKERILEGALVVFKNKGLKFTMDDLASEMKMSKKTIYTIFQDKNELLCDMVDYAFDLIKEEEEQIYNNAEISTVDKIRGILGVLPESYNGFDFQTLYQFADKYPKAYEKISVRLDSGWDKTFELINKGIAEGTVKKVDFTIFKLTYEAAVERMLMTDILEKEQIDYPTAFSELVNLMIDGIIIK